MKADRYDVGEYYRIETISHLFTAQFNGQHLGQFQFLIVDERQQKVGVVLEFTVEELTYAMITPAQYTQQA